MVVFIEPLGKPYAHLSVLKSLLIAELKANDNQILFLSTPAYFNSIPLEYRERLKFKEIELSNSSFKNIFEVFFIVISVFLNYRKVDSLKIYLLLSKSYTNFLLKLYSFIFLSSTRKLLIMLHGDLQNVDLKGGRSAKLDGLMQRITYWIDTKLKTNLRFVTISKFVYNSLATTLGYIPKNIIGIDLRYKFDEFDFNDSMSCPCLNISTVGVNSNNKKSYLLNDLAQLLADEIRDGLIKVNISGRNDGVQFSSLINVASFGGKYLLSTEEYAKLVMANDILLFFNDEDYNLISSGSYFDCINFKKPLLALRTKQWEYNFKVFGEIGYLCYDVSEMAYHIRRFLNEKNVSKQFENSLTMAKNELSIIDNEGSLLLELDI